MTHSSRKVTIVLEIHPDLDSMSPLDLEEQIEKRLGRLEETSDWWGAYVNGWLITADPTP